MESSILKISLHPWFCAFKSVTDKTFPKKGGFLWGGGVAVL